MIVSGGGISEPFIRRPIGTSLLAIALLILGTLSYFLLPVSSLPKIDFPTFTVTALLPGGDPETMAASVAAPLERRLGQIAGVNEMTSVSGVGTASVTLQFSLDRSADLAARDVQAAITSARSELPTNLPNPPTWRRTNPADVPILIATVTSSSMTTEKVYESASNILAQRMSQVSGVSSVIIAGAQKSAVRVQVDPTKLANMGLGMEDVRAALVAANAHGPKGNFDGKLEAYMIEVNDQVFEAANYRPLVLKSKGGTIVRISDVATVIDGPVDVRNMAWSGPDRCVLVIVYKQPNANVIETVDSVKALLPKLEKWMPPGTRTIVTSDRTTSIRASVKDVQITLLITIILVVAIVFLFLGKLWSTFAAALTVPLSLAGTTAGMYLCGYSLDNISLMALTVAVGFVVDDAIVMIENVTRRRELGDDPLQAALAGSRQIGFTVLSISISLVAVFIPLFFMGGLVGRLFREFAVTLSISIAVSALVSLTVTPMVCAYLAKNTSTKNGVAPHKNIIERASEFIFARVISIYAFLLNIVLRFRIVTLLFTIATVGLTIYLYIVIPKGFFPIQDTSRLQITTESPSDTSFQTMALRQKEVIDIVRKNPNVRTCVSSVGASGYSAIANQGRFFVELVPPDQRKDTIQEVIQQMSKEVAAIKGINFFPRAVQDIQVGGRLSKNLYQYALSGMDVGELNDFAPKLLERLKSIKELQGVTTDQVLGGLEARLVIDRDAAARYGIAPSDIDSALYNAFGQRQVALMYTERDQNRVVLEVDSKLTEDPSALEKIYVKAPRGLQVPLKNVAKFVRSSLSLSVTHQGQFPAVTIAYGLAPGVALGEASNKIEEAFHALNPPEGIHASFQGSAQAFQDSRSSQVTLILTALLAIYIILGVLYESLIHPLTILSTIPSAGIGALLALMAFNFPLDVMGLISIILLIGIVKKNAIMMIDFALEAERDHKKPALEAIREACLLRFRPIIMTTMAALLGSLPLALGHGVGSELRRPLGVAIIGGLLMSQALTLFTTPVVYVFLDGLRQKSTSAKQSIP